MIFNELLERKNEYMKTCSNFNYSRLFNKEELKFFFTYIFKELHINQKISCSKISKTCKISESTLKSNFKKLGFVPINRQNSLRVRENLFENITTEEDAYWLGFIYADGYISDEGKFEISLKHTDYEHLLKFADYCGFDRSKVKKKDKTNFPNSFRCRIGFATQHLKQRFFDLGIIPRKSCKLVYPEFLSEHLHRHFIRGYVDGDGCFNNYSKTATRKGNLFLQLLGTELFLIEVMKKLNINKKLFPNSRNLESCCYFFKLWTREAQKILNFLYEDATIYLDRKNEIYINKVKPY